MQQIVLNILQNIVLEFNWICLPFNFHSYCVASELGWVSFYYTWLGVDLPHTRVIWTNPFSVCLNLQWCLRMSHSCSDRACHFFPGTAVFEILHVRLRAMRPLLYADLSLCLALVVSAQSPACPSLCMCVLQGHSDAKGLRYKWVFL